MANANLALLLRRGRARIRVAFVLGNTGNDRRAPGNQHLVVIVVRDDRDRPALALSRIAGECNRRKIDQLASAPTTFSSWPFVVIFVVIIVIRQNNFWREDASNSSSEASTHYLPTRCRRGQYVGERSIPRGVGWDILVFVMNCGVVAVEVSELHIGALSC